MAIDKSGQPTYAITFGRSTSLGRALVSALLSSSQHSLIRILDPLESTGAPGPAPVFSDRISYHRADFSDRTQLIGSLSGSSVVFHVDPTRSLQSESFGRIHSLAVGFTKALLSACPEAGVRRMVYTGSSDVVISGVGDICNADESLAYPDKFDDALSELRAQVEMRVLSANGKNGLHTCALRPSFMFGPGDESLVPFIVSFARSFFSKIIIGNGKNKCDFTYTENVAHATICADKALSLDPVSVSGKPYFVTNDEPVETWEFISSILEGLGYQRPLVRLPAKILLTAASVTELTRQKIGFVSLSSRLLSPSIIYLLSCTRTFNCSMAKTILGYTPVVRLEDGVARTVESFSNLANGSSFDGRRELGEPSKARKFLGTGLAADILLWRDDRRTFLFVMFSFLFYYMFLLSGRTFLSALGSILLVISVSLFGHGCLPHSVYGFTIEKLPPDCFRASEATTRNLFRLFASLWNGGVHTVLRLAEGRDWNLLFKAVLSLYILRLLFHLSLPILVGFGLLCAFSGFIIYDQCEHEIDMLIAAAFVRVELLARWIISKLPSSVLDRISNFL
ncbi:3beta-hydroxysteroid-dehydrogenase/decarboxylase isoform 3 [Carex littledalei]|uniref:Reticulon-like protein n=1 Tax=Carex littledalei TaxID=544730 RepID=A0A833VKD8_9POAL|nr:3beta-hydroxysteroid-dehydrogenase/decarboxylase isoform 3 [Carex littledalei]